ncbi:MAG: DUF4192 domain-containing protein [Actinomycetota bacterium]|nr:DUF4192 domain-containing protein [Actinomycetota bacterium]
MYSEGTNSEGTNSGLATEVRLRLSSPPDVVAAVPYLLGFHPRDSLVLVSIGDRRVSLASRIDLPPLTEAKSVAGHLARIVAEQSCDQVLVVIVGGGVDHDVPPRTDVVAAARAAFGKIGIPVSSAVWVPEVTVGATWRCYDSDAGGTLPDPTSSPVAAATVAAGHVTYPDRQHLEQLVSPADPADLDRRSRLLDSHCDQQCDQLRGPSELDEPDRGADAFALLRAWVEKAGAESLDLGDDDIVMLCVALSDPMVRDAAFGLADGPYAAGAERLWTALVREFPDPEAAEPAVLLAYSALLRGNGALVGIALERAQRAWPGHRMSELFQSAIDGGLGPDDLRGWFAEGAAEARLLLRRRGAR